MPGSPAITGCHISALLMAVAERLIVRGLSIQSIQSIRSLGRGICGGGADQISPLGMVDSASSLLGTRGAIRYCQESYI